MALEEETIGMTPASGSATIGKRYVLHDMIGSGGMGTVYRATDRLTGDLVALKRVQADEKALLSKTLSDVMYLRTALAQEFRTLASLRHPHVVSVLDYGFDSERQPYFTMDVLENARTIIEAARGLDIDAQVRLLVQLLQALTYLHRRGILHRDLKPANVLVLDGKVKVLDFGLAVAREYRQESNDVLVGTLAYMAPELFQGAAASEASDLYAVGMIAYEIFAGRYPFQTDNSTKLIYSIFNEAPDLSVLEVEAPLRLAIGRLVSKSPAERYTDAQQLIDEYAEITHQDELKDTAAIRESFLQAASFIGRDLEMSKLSAALKRALAGRGSAWLVGGESGVGKSRLLDELRTQALVEGVLTAQGQSISEGGGPYQLWRAALRLIALESDLTDEEAAVFKSLVTDIGTLLGRDIGDAPELDPQQMQSRFFKTVSDVLKRVARPVLIILEDLHWAGSESLALLDHLTHNAPDTPLVLVGSYRDDEKPELPKQLPGTERLKLERLSQAAVAALSESMLGTAGTREQVLSLLYRETEGNVFFLVEVVRALAEQAGKLHLVGQKTLPRSIFAGGIQAAVNRRLEHVPASARPLLRLAAVAGRQLDPKILQMLVPDTSVEDWLTACSNAAVLDVQDANWRFAHDKLREGILADLSDEEKQKFHRRIADAIEQVYPDDVHQYANLAHHWSMAKDTAKVVHYAALAGDQAMLTGANLEAKRFYEQALEALADQAETDDNRRVLIDLALKLAKVGAYNPSDNMLVMLQKALQAADALSDEGLRARVLASTGAYHYVLGQLGQALGYFSQSMGLAEKLGLEELLVLPYNILGRAVALSGDWPKAESMLARGIDLIRRVKYDPELLAGSEVFYAAVLMIQGQRAEGERHAEEGMRVVRQLGLPSRLAGNLMTMGFAHAFSGSFDAAAEYLRECIRVSEENGDFQPLYTAHGCLGYVYLQQGDIEKAKEHLDEALEMTAKAVALPFVPMYHGFRAEIDVLDNAAAIALERAEKALATAEAARQEMSKGEIFRVLGKIYMQMDEAGREKARDFLERSIELHNRYNARTLAAISTLELARFYLKQGQPADAEIAVQKARTMFDDLDMKWHAEQARSLVTS